MITRRYNTLVALCTIGAALGACAGGPSLPSPGALLSGAPTASQAPQIPSEPVQTATVQPASLAVATTESDDGLTSVDPLGDAAATGITGSTLVPGSLVSVYSRMAKGLNRCWLRDGRPLGKVYVLHAAIEPSPAHTGGMTVHLRSPTGRRGLKAYHVDLSHIGGQTRVTTTNMKLLPKQSGRLTRDLLRWAINGSDCGSYVAHVPTPRRKPGVRRQTSSAF